MYVVAILFWRTIFTVRGRPYDMHNASDEMLPLKGNALTNCILELQSRARKGPWNPFLTSSFEPQEQQPLHLLFQIIAFKMRI